MSHSTLPALPVLPFHTFPQPQLSLCCRETVISDGSTGEFNRAFPCTRPAVIHDLATEQDYCFECWKAVGRG